MKKWDWIIISAICCASVTAMFWQHVSPAVPANALSLEVYLDGALIEMLPLPNAPTEYRIESATGYNIILLEPDKVRMISADCAGQDCVHTAPIARPRQIIACSPHRLLLQLVGQSAPDDVDAITG